METFGVLLSLFTILRTAACLPSGSVSVSATNALNLAPIVSADQLYAHKSPAYGAPFPDSGRKHAVIEVEPLLSKKESAYGYFHQFFANIFHPRDVVDTLREEDKYGNDGGKGRAVGTAIIGGLEKGSNLLNIAVEVPFAAATQIGKKVTAQLNLVGGKLVGLSY